MLSNKESCIGCGLCSLACPQKCIEMQMDNYGFRYPQIDDLKCIKCKICEKVCPIFHEHTVSKKSQYYAVKNKDDYIRQNSSSGGAFFEFASEIIKKGGVVCAAEYNKDFVVEHNIATTIEELRSFCGAKYSQSRFEHCFEEICIRLKRKQKVLFVGTPCQTFALKTNIDKELWENLILMDLICHGVPSPLVFQRYLEEKKEVFANGSLLTSINLRDKTTGWSKYSYCVYLGFENGIIYQKKQNEDCFMQGFTKNLYLRSSCENCIFKGLERSSDITLGDFWGIWDIAPTFDDNKGISLLMIHGSKGRALWEDIREKFQILEVNSDQAVANNPSAMYSSITHPRKVDFFRMLDSGWRIEDAIRNCLYGSEKKSIFSFIKDIILKRKN